MTTKTPAQHLAILKAHNAWRRGATRKLEASPEGIGEAIDYAIGVMEAQTKPAAPLKPNVVTHKISHRRSSSMNTRISTTRPAIGEAFGGGFFAGLIRIGSSTYGLVVAPKENGEINGEWGPRPTLDGARSFFDGMANTDVLAEAGSDIAKWVRGLNIAEHTDWYIPSRDELEVCYRNLKPTDDANVCWCGDNPSAYLPSYAYSIDTPALSTAKEFQEGGTQAFDPRRYWSSTQYAGNADGAWHQHFDDGDQDDGGKSFQARARAVRRFLID